MLDVHLSRDLLRAVSRGELPPRLIVQVGLKHLTGLCSHCRREVEAWLREQRTTGGGIDYSNIFQNLPRIIEEQAPRIAKEQEMARRDLKTLLALPFEERANRIHRARNRFRGAALAELLLEESHTRIHADAGGALHLADLARTVLYHSPHTVGVFDLIALATGYVANACRARGELRQAAEHFAHVRYIVTHEGVTDPGILGRLDDLEGSLRKDQRLFREAEELMNRAALLYRLAGAQREHIRVTINLADVYFYEGAVDRAVTTLLPAIQELRREEDARLYLCGRHNLTVYLVELERHQEAAGLLEEDRELYAGFPDQWTQLRLSWLKGRIAAGEGEVEAAEELFVATRAGFLAQGIGYDAAMVSLDLALCYLRLSETAEVRRVAEEMLPILTAQDLHCEAVAALILFQDAAQREDVTVTLIRDLRRFLRDLQADPSLRFQAPS